MTKCKGQPNKNRVSRTGKGKPGKFKRGIKGHAWKHYEEKDKSTEFVHTGRECDKCGLIQMHN